MTLHQTLSQLGIGVQVFSAGESCRNHRSCNPTQTCPNTLIRAIAVWFTPNRSPLAHAGVLIDLPKDSFPLYGFLRSANGLLVDAEMGATSES